MDNINFKKVLDDGELFDQQANYEENFEKINQLVVPKITDLETNKVDKVAGKGLSTNDYTTTEKNKLAGIPVDTAAQLSGKVDKVTGKGLSTNDFSNEYKAKIDVDIPAQLADIETLKADKLTTYTRTEIDTKDDLKANKMQEEWITPTLLNGAVGSYLSYRPFQYRKNQFGNLEFRGLIGLGTYTSGAVLFEFPSGYRVQVMTSHVGGTAGSARGISVELSPNGQVKVFGTLVGYIVFGAVMTL